MLVASTTRLAVFCVLMLLKREVEQGAAGMISDKADASTLATVPTIGPPNSTNFSRRKEVQPAPPLPERTWILTESTNFMEEVVPQTRKKLRNSSGNSIRTRWLR